MLDLKGQTAIVTGASRGLGLAIAESLGRQGARVYLIATNMERLEAAADGLKEKGVDVAGLRALDVSDSEAVQKTLETMTKDSGSVEILVNNAGITRDGLLMRMKDDDFDKVLSVNLKSVFLCSRAMMRTMLKQRYGRIVNISSIVGVRGQAGQANYAASKAGIIGFTKSLAREVAARGITCNAVAPGFIASDMTYELSDDQKTSILSQIPMGRMGQVEEVGALVNYLCSREAGYMTGQVLSLDGGMGI